MQGSCWLYVHSFILACKIPWENKFWFFTSNIHQHKLTLSVYGSHPNAILSEAIEDLVTCSADFATEQQYACAHTHTHACTYTHTHAHTVTCTHMDMHTFYTCTCVYVCIRVLEFHLIVIRYFTCQVLQYTRHWLCRIHQQMCEVARLVCFSCIRSVFLGTVQKT